MARSVASALLVVALGSTAFAQPKQSTVSATALFDKGRQLMTDGKFADACLAFEQSQQIEEAAGTQYNLAGCYVKIGKLASAWAAYRELAQTDTNAGRRKDAETKAKALAPRLPKLLITAPNHPDDFVVQLNGLDVTSLIGVDTPIDLGTHQIVARAAGHADKTLAPAITAEGKTVTVEIVLAKTDATPAVVDVPVQEAPAKIEPPAKSHRTTYALIVGGAGLALVGTGLYFGSAANGDYSDAKDLCGDGPACDTPANVGAANDLVDDARGKALISTVLVAGGAVAIGVGVVLILTGKSEERPTSTAWRVSPGTQASPLGLSFGGAF